VAAEKVLSDTPLYPGDDAPPIRTKKVWKVRLGGFGWYHPRYEGSDDYELAGFPFFDVSWRNVFFNPRKGLGFSLTLVPSVKVGLALGYTFGRDEDDAAALNGLGDVDAGLTVNGFLEWEMIEGFSMDIRYEQQITGEETGFQCQFGLGYRMFLPPGLIIRPSIAATYASDSYMQAYFGVDGEQSARSGYSKYDSDPGIKSAGIQMMVIYPFMGKWALQMLGGYERLVGDAADSPVVRDADQYTAGLGLSYSF